MTNARQEFFQHFADSLLRGERDTYLAYFKLPIALCYPEKTVMVDDPKVLKHELDRIPAELRDRRVARLEAHVEHTSGVLDGAFRARVRYAMIARSGRDIGDFTSNYYCEIQPDGSFLINFAACELLAQLAH